MSSVVEKAYAKINLSLDVLRRLENGYHEVEMVMQQILLNDEIDVKWKEGGEDFAIELRTNRSYLPTDERNLAYKAALLMHEVYGEDRKGLLRIDIKKLLSGYEPIDGETGKTMKYPSEYNGKYIKCEITPVDIEGNKGPE